MGATPLGSSSLFNSFASRFGSGSFSAYFSRNAAPTLERMMRKSKLWVNPRERRRFSYTWKSHRRDRTGWLGRQDSNLGMAESKSTCSAFSFNGHFEKTDKFAPFPINRLAPMSECAVRASRPGGASYSIGGTVGPRIVGLFETTTWTCLGSNVAQAIPREAVCRQRLSGADFCERARQNPTSSRNRNRQTIRSRQRVRAVTQALDRRTNHRMAQSLSPARQGLGKSQPQRPRVLETCLHPPHAAKAL